MGEGISLRHWLLPHLRRQYHSLLPILTQGREYHSDTGCCLTSRENTTPSCLSSLWQGISLRHWLLPHLRREYHSPLSIVTIGREYHSDTGCCLTSGENTTPSCLSSLWQGISLRHWLLPQLRREYHSLLPILTWGKEYHSDTGCCLTSGDNTTPSCLSSLGVGISLRHWLLPHLRIEYHSLLSILTHCREYHSDTGCCLTSGDNTTPSCLSSLGEGILLRHWLLSHLRRQYHSLLPILTAGREFHSDTGCCLTSGDNTTPSCLSSLGGGNITQTLAAASPQETIPLPPAYPHCGEGISLRHWLLPHLRTEYHSLLPILTWGKEYHSDTGCCLTSGDNTTPSCLSSLGVGISLRHWLLPHLRIEYHSLLSILTHCREYHSDTGCCLTSGDNTTPSCLSSLGEGILLRHWLLPHLRREYHSLLSILTHGKEYHSDTGCCLTSGDNTTPSCLSSLGEGISLRHWLLPHLRRQYHSLLPILTVAGNITQTLAAASPQETIPLPPAYPHCGGGISLRHYLLPHPQLTIPLPPVYRHSGEGISLRHWLLPHLRRQYHSLLPILTRGGNITLTLAAASPQETIPLPPAYPHSGWEYHSDTGCCLTSGENTTPSCLSSLAVGISLRHRLLPHLRREYHFLLPILTRGGNITQTLAAASPQETIPLPPAYPHSGREYHSDTGCCLNSGENTTPSCLSSLRARNITQTQASASIQERIPLFSLLPQANLLTDANVKAGNLLLEASHASGL